MLCHLLGSEDDLKTGASALVDRAEDCIDSLVQLELRAIQDVGDASALHVTPEPLDQVEIGRVGWEPEDLQVLGHCRQVGEHLLGFVECRAVADQHDLSPGLLGPLDQSLYQVMEAQTAFRFADVVDNLACGEVKGTVDHPLLVLTRTRNTRLATSGGPDRCEVGVEMELRFILVPEFVRTFVLESLFFSSARRFCARRCSFSSLLPLSVCLGR